MKLYSWRDKTEVGSLYKSQMLVELKIIAEGFEMKFKYKIYWKQPLTIIGRDVLFNTYVPITNSSHRKSRVAASFIYM